MGEMIIPLKQQNILSSNEVLVQINCTTGESAVLLSAEDRHVKILNAESSKVDIISYIQEL